MVPERAIITSWSQTGDNVLWHRPYGGRTTPIVMNGQLYAITPVGTGKCLQERVICLNAKTGDTLWQHRFNVFHTDIVENRLGWTSVVGDPETGNVYAHGTGGEFFCFDPDGNVLWKHSLGEAFGRYSGYGGRLHTPIIDEDRVIISYIYILSNWGTGKRKSGHRYVAFDKRTGDVIWWSQPGGKPFDTTYSVPVVSIIDGKRMIVAANADGSIYGMLARNGERVWKFALSKRGINSSVVVDGNYAYATHSEENIEGTVMGRVVCIDATKTGDITETGEVWRADGLQVGYASPAIANGRLYVVTNAATLICLNAKTGDKIWEYELGRVMKGSPIVTADGVIYAGEVNGRFLTLKDQGSECKLLDLEKFDLRDGEVVEINGSPAFADGRLYFMNSRDLYCLGEKGRDGEPVAFPTTPYEPPPNYNRTDTVVSFRINPGDVTIHPGDQIKFKLRGYDDHGRRVAFGVGGANWEIKGVDGDINQAGAFTANSENRFSAGEVIFTSHDLKTSARLRITPRLPIDEPFDGMTLGEQPPGWIGLDLKTKLVEKDGSVVLQKLMKSPSAPYCRMRAFSGPPIPTGYTVEADILGSHRAGRRPTLSDMGLINSRYKLILLGREKQLRVVSYSPIPRLQEEVPFDWQPDVWYRAKLWVDVRDNKGIIKGKVWPRDDLEPEAWTIEVVDPCPNHQGSPGLYAYTKGTTPRKEGAAVFFDNYRVYRND
jgi:outer membrane protein assembly factor BamB